MKAIKFLQAVLLMLLIAFAASSRKMEANSAKSQTNEEKAKMIFVKNKTLNF